MRRDECPVDTRPGEREIHGGISPARQAQQREPEKDNSPVDCCPGERPSQEGLGRYASDAGTATRSTGGNARARGGNTRSSSEPSRRRAGTPRTACPCLQARQGERSAAGARRRRLHYVEHVFRAQRRRRGHDSRDAGRLHGCRTTAGMQDDCRDAGARATQEQLPS